MSPYSFSISERELMIRAVDELNRMGLSAYAADKANALRIRLSSGSSSLTSGELKNICIGLELILDGNPLDWAASRLLMRLRGVLIENNVKPDSIR